MFRPTVNDKGEVIFAGADDEYAAISSELFIQLLLES